MPVAPQAASSRTACLTDQVVTEGQSEDLGLLWGDFGGWGLPGLTRANLPILGRYIGKQGTHQEGGDP